jgi:hypothetical protein
MRTPRRIISALLLVSYLPLSLACHSIARYPVSSVSPSQREHIAGVILGNGRRVQFAAEGRIVRDTVYGTLSKGQREAFPLTDVNHLLIRKFDGLKTFGAVVGAAAGILAVAVVIVAATKESCPFVYSWDGERWVFDAEPYGGATTRGLERDDYGVLEHLRAVNGEYRLLLTNEVNESQMTNLLELLVIDHGSGIRPVADEFGRFHTVRAPSAPLSARDQRGTDLRRWLVAADDYVWEPQPSLDASRTRDTVTLSFAKPQGARTMKLVARVATGAWGSHMIRTLLGLRGSAVESWYHHIDGNPLAADSVRQWSIREGLYGLPVEVREPGGWRVRGILAGGGPFLAEDRVVSLDVSRAAGDRVELRLLPARSFWGLNWLAADFSPDQTVRVDTLALTSAIDQTQGDVRDALSRSDASYHVLPAPGDQATLTFKAPPPRPGLERTVFVHARGWYHLRGLPATAENQAVLARVTGEPGFAARLAAEEYRRLLLARRH